MTPLTYEPNHTKWLKDTLEDCKCQVKRAELELRQAQLDLEKAQTELDIQNAKLLHYRKLLNIEDAEAKLAEERRAAKEKAK